VTYATNTVQQVVTNFFDAAGRITTSTNALGESTVTTADALGRTTSFKIYSPSHALVREQYLAYSTDHNSVTVTDGSGTSGISHTTWTDTDGHTVLSIATPSAGVRDFILNQYDLAGNAVAVLHDTSAGGTITNWTTASMTYDSLNRLTQKVDRDGAVTTYAYDPMNDLTNRVMPGANLAWAAVYANSGQLLQAAAARAPIATPTLAAAVHSPDCCKPKPMLAE
jgi:YD repeat-containing protein